RPEPVSFESLRHEAQDRARKPYMPELGRLPMSLADLDYDEYRAIEYRPKRALWASDGLPFEVEFFHRGYLFPKRVRIFVLQHGQASEVHFSPKMFDYSRSTVQPDRLPEDLGFAGFRLLVALHPMERYSEFVSFLGASYFRARGAGEVFGASARGLSVGMGSPDEEFPFFDAFWIEKPAANAKTITVYASMDSPSLTGVYRFDISPGIETRVDVHADVFARTTLARVGVAPLTSMYFYGLNGPVPPENDRPEVHDSDGLLIAGHSSEWIWRPLWNPKTLSLSTFEIASVNGFGLMQRDRDPCDYNDSGALYQKRPNIWVEPLKPWQGRGVQLLELPSNWEGQDNIGVCWLPPEEALAAGSLALAYRLHFGESAREPANLGKVASTRWSESGGAGARFELDFSPGAGGPDSQVAASAAAAKITTTTGQVGSVWTRPDPSGKYWRLTFEATPQVDQIMDIRVFLQQGGRRFTEVWSFAWPR
ncbi:MAG: glucan biosynthesis protein, partial [Sedimentisphaerales bacterium]